MAEPYETLSKHDRAYSGLLGGNNLLTKGQPIFFTPTNLPAGNSIPGFGTGRLKAFATLEVT